jgi:sec-independent protein translocase protein TatC
MHIKVSIFLGIAIAMPYIIWEVWKFIKPGLYDNEKKHARGFVGVSSMLFIMGIMFGYYIIAPFAISFLSNYSVADDAVSATATLSSYVSYLTMFTFPSGILFQLPIVVYFLTKIGVITPKFLSTYRRHAYVVLLVLSAVITPPDVVSQVLICIPLYFLYEISILISKRVFKKLEEKS